MQSCVGEMLPEGPIDTRFPCTEKKLRTREAADACELAVLLFQTCKGRTSLSHNHEEEATLEPFLLFCSWHLVPMWTPYPLSHT